MMFCENQGRANTVCRLGLLLGFLLCGLEAGAQLKVGDNLGMNLAGAVGFGYSGGFGNTFTSGHGQSLSTDLNLTGYYFHPNLLSFRVHPFYARSQSNASTGVTSRDNGVETTVDLFSGSHFPGSIGFAKGFGSSTEYGIPGIGRVASDGSGQSFNIAWAELIPGLPPLYANFNMSSNSYSLLGTSERNHSSAKNFTLTSNYRLKGFDLVGTFGHQTSSFSSPSFLGIDANSGGGSSTSYAASASHTLPLRGNFGVGVGHSSYGDSSGSSKGSNTNLNVGAGIQPLSRLNISTNATYNTNSTVALFQDLGSDVSFVPVFRDFDSKSIRLSTNATLSLNHGLSLHGYANTTKTFFLGRDQTYSSYGGTLTYNYSSWLGMFRFFFGLVDTASQEGNSGLSLVSGVGMSRKFGRWETSADFSYSQMVETLGLLETSSSFSYGGSIRRRINEDTFWSGSFRSAKTALVQEGGTRSGTEGISSNFTWKRYGVGVSYARTHGTSIVTASGLLIPTPLAVLITDDFILTNGHSLSVSGSGRLLRRLLVRGSYSESRTETLARVENSLIKFKTYDLHVEYKVRKLALVGGFKRVEQAIAPTAMLPTVVNSYYIRLTRWFNFF